MIKHTLGPWKTNEAIVYVEGEEEDFAICHTQSMQTNAISDYEKCCANARLIAAAPELLEALEKATQELHEAIYTRAANTWATPDLVAYEHANQLTESYRALIAKAKGE